MSFRLFASYALVLIAATSLTASEVRVWGSTNTADAPAAAWASIYAVPAGLTDVTQVAVTGSTIAALRANGSVVVWGVAGDPTLTVPIGAQSGVTQIAASFGGAVYALRNNGTVVAWGDPATQQLAVPSGLTGVAAVRGGFANGLAIRADGSVIGWGRDTVVPPTNFTCVDATTTGVARKSDSTLVHWDTRPGTSYLDIPPGLTGAGLFSSGSGSVGVVNSSGQVTVWGITTAGQANVPAGLTGIAELAFGDDHVVARSTSGSLTIWGNGLTARPEIAVPIGWTGCQKIAAGYRFTVGVFATAPNGSAPTAVTLSSTAVPYQAAGGLVIGTLGATDADPGDRPTFALVTGNGSSDNAAFSISGSQLTVGTSPLAAPANSTVSVRIRATDSGGLTVYSVFALTIGPAPVTADESTNNGFFGGCGVGSGVSIVLGSLAFTLRFLWKRHS